MRLSGLSATSESRVYTQEELEAMELEVLDGLAYGVTDGDTIEVHPSELSIRYPGDLANAEEKERVGGMDWLKSVDLSEPIEVAVQEDGSLSIEDGHHRYYAALKLGVPIRAEVTVKGNPIRAILRRQQREVESAPPIHPLASGPALDPSPNSMIPPLNQRTVEQHIEYLESIGFVNAARELRAHMDGSVILRPVFRGDFRADKVADIDPEKLQSGGGIYFTESPDLAGKYAEEKEYYAGEEIGDYAAWFRVQTPRGTFGLDKAGRHLSAVQKDALRRVLVALYEDVESGDIQMDGAGDPDDCLLSEQSVREHIERARGDVLRAAKTLLLDSGILYGSEEVFERVLATAGIPGYLNDPRAARPGVTAAYLRICSPIDAANPDPRFVDMVRDMAEREGLPEAKVLYRELLTESGKPSDEVFWATSIPQSVVRRALELGFDGVTDVGGKHGTGPENVWVAFHPSQVMNAIAIPGMDLDLGLRTERSTRSRFADGLATPSNNRTARRRSL